MFQYLRLAFAFMGLSGVAFAQLTPGSAQLAPTLAPLATAGPAGVVPIDLAGRSLQEFPWFTYEAAWFQGSQIEIAFDTQVLPVPSGAVPNVYIVAHKSAAQWANDPTLVDVSGTPRAIQIEAGGVRENRFVIDTGLLSGDAGAGLGVAYDVIVDFDLNGLLSAGDFADGTLDEAGFFVLAPTAAVGPFAVTEVLYTGGSFLGQDLYYPTNIAALGNLPLVVVSHGNGHNYTWYDHIGRHLASYGMIVMSHQNNTVPGPDSAATTTITNTEYLLANVATIAGGALAGHLDATRIAWLGHSRGAEGVVIAYDRLFDGTYAPVNFTKSSIKLVSSIAPTDFLGPNVSNPHDVPFSLWTGGADDDVSGCPGCDQCQTFHLHDRATRTRQSISIHGVGHGAFHDGGGSTVAAGPCQLTRTDTHAIMKAYLLPLMKHYLEGNVIARECLWRQWEEFHSPGTSESLCVNVDLMYREDPAIGNFIVDDFQVADGPGISSSGAAMVWNMPSLVEGRFDDANGDFSFNTVDPMNGITLGGPADNTRGIVFEWGTSGGYLSFDLVPAAQDLNPFPFISFRAAQLTRAPNTLAELYDLTFSIRLADGDGTESTIHFGTYGGGIEEPYLRSGCGTGIGWGADFETVRVPVRDFLREGVPLNLAQITRIDFLFGEPYGSSVGRLAFDDLTLCVR
ncbi:MAG: hypothetical protein JNL28_01485 [Planctomycetes bacterium]|nr:hypothetical protein [Planctomycetota bacterium]